MPHSNFKTRERGQVSLFALVMMTILLNLAMAQFHFVNSSLKGQAAHWSAQRRDAFLLNGEAYLLHNGAPGAGELSFEGDGLLFQWRQAEQGPVLLHQLSYRSRNHVFWPETTVLWLETPTCKLMLRDYRWE